METMKYHHFLFFMLIGNLCFQMSRAIETTHINCEKGIAEPVVIGPVEEGYSGIVETITGVPIDTGLQLVKFGFESHLQYVELNHTSGSDTAEVLTKGKLDAEDFHDTSGEIYYAIKCVKNSVLNNRILRITDINDNVPVFQLNNYSVTVSEAHQVGVSIIKVMAEDRDTSPENNRITYSIVPPAPSEFEVQARDGAILLKSPLNYNRASSYSFNVKAQDPKNESSQTNVAITVTDYDNMSPYFSHSLYSATIPEHKTGELSTVHPAAIEAKDGDLGLNTPVSYSINTVTPQEYTSSFNINEDNGIVSVLTALDRELIETIEINIKASQRDDSLKTADATVFVKIEDVNDNPPEFDKDSYTVNITENSPNGTVILQVKVTDRDEGGFRGVLRITPEDSPFEISADGVITVKNSIALDREKRTSFFLQIVAKEDSPPQREQTVNVLVHLLDENDNSPSFDSSEYVGKVFKNQTVGMTVVKVEAVDPDQGANGQVKYKIDAGNQDTYFHIDPDTGVITLLKEIVLEENRVSHFLLHVRATDGGEVPRASSVAVDICAPGDSNPQFLKPTYEGTVLEEQDAPVQIVKVDFMSLNPVVPATLRILTETDKFEIDKNGVISTKVKLDYESHRNHSISISISDGMSEDLGNVIVKVVDINDNSPVFAGNYPDVALPEAAENGTVVANMVAMDVDDGFNAEISFALQGSEGNFDIDPRTGQITLVKELDREVKAKYNLIAIARDQGQPSKSSTVAFGVNVVDVNDNYPVFSLARYEVEIPEDMSVGNAVLNVTAVDLDEGPNSVVEYRIVGQTPSDPLVFTLDRVSGALSLSSPLNFEIVRQYILTVEAKDGGSPSLQSTCSVLIRVLDVNDNPPQFDEDEYHISVYETIPSGAAVFTVSVTDKDEDGFSKGHFILNSSTFNMNNQGTLSLNSDASLDREEKSNYILMVVAVDRDAGGLSSSAVLNITVLDVNDNNPQFITLPQNINIAEGNYRPDAPGEICRIGAIDFDEGENGHVTLSVLSADANVLFQFQKARWDVSCCGTPRSRD
ncbi:cadherin EGF LAG seven-pass G-type receptor 2-like [Lepisosteus oculatus]|uniref:cadherin EGF LAG seven-pass G-type receptor 2-like n=1 Tax=Lepisosteus oculatus TaxID=7918 RepID=UPI0035F50511